VECIVADVFLGRLVRNLHSANLTLIAPVADVSPFEVGEVGCSRGLDRAMFRLLGNTDIDIAAGAIGVDDAEKVNPLIRSRSNDTGEFHLLSEDLVAFLSMLLR